MMVLKRPGRPELLDVEAYRHCTVLGDRVCSLAADRRLDVNSLNWGFAPDMANDGIRFSQSDVAAVQWLMVDRILLCAGARKKKAKLELGSVDLELLKPETPANC
jgi:hypothetical protein